MVNNCPKCRATEHSPCVTKAGKPTSRHKGRPGGALSGPSKISYQPNYRPNVPPPPVTSSFDDAARYVIMSESFGWTDDTTSPLEWIKLLIADYQVSLESALEAVENDHKTELNDIAEERDQAREQVETLERALAAASDALKARSM